MFKQTKSTTPPTPAPAPHLAPHPHVEVLFWKVSSWHGLFTYWLHVSHCADSLIVPGITFEGSFLVF